MRECTVSVNICHSTQWASISMSFTLPWLACVGTVGTRPLIFMGCVVVAWEQG